MKYISLLTLLLILALALFACAPKSAPAASTFPPVPADYAGKANPLGAEAAANGALDYVSYCEACHGASGQGDGPAGSSLEPRPANLIAVAAQVGDDYLYWRVAEGKPGTSMVAWKNVLNEEQIWQIVAHLRTLK